MKKIFGWHQAEVKTLAGVVGAAYYGNEDLAAIQHDADVGRLFQTLAESAQDTLDTGAHVVGVSSQAAE